MALTRAAATAMVGGAKGKETNRVVAARDNETHPKECCAARQRTGRGGEAPAGLDGKKNKEHDTGRPGAQTRGAAGAAQARAQAAGPEKQRLYCACAHVDERTYESCMLVGVWVGKGRQWVARARRQCGAQGGRGATGSPHAGGCQWFSLSGGPFRQRARRASTRGTQAVQRNFGRGRPPQAGKGGAGRLKTPHRQARTQPARPPAEAHAAGEGRPAPSAPPIRQAAHGAEGALPRTGWPGLFFLV